MARRALPEPLRPGDEQTAREEVEDYYRRRIEQAEAALAKARAARDGAVAEASAALGAFTAGQRLSQVDAWAVELHAGGRHDLLTAAVLGDAHALAAVEEGRARKEATRRWLRHEGYEPTS